MLDDGLETVTSRAQEELEEVIAERYERLAEELEEGNLSSLHLRRHRHARFVGRGLGVLGAAFSSLLASRPWIVYWCVHSLALLGAPVPAKPGRESAIALLLACQAPEGGFGCAPGAPAHLATTYASLAALTELGAVQSVDRRALARFLLASARDPALGGGFHLCREGEVDVRGAYVALAAARLARLDCRALARRAGLATHLRACRTHEGGYGGEPGNEAHGGNAYCAIAAAALAAGRGAPAWAGTAGGRGGGEDEVRGGGDGRGSGGGGAGASSGAAPSSPLPSPRVPHPQTSHFSSLSEWREVAASLRAASACRALALLGGRTGAEATLEWVARLQLPLEGGFAGRTSKLADACYSFWQGGGARILEGVLRETQQAAEAVGADGSPAGGAWDAPGAGGGRGGRGPVPQPEGGEPSRIGETGRPAERARFAPLDASGPSPDERGPGHAAREASSGRRSSKGDLAGSGDGGGILFMPEDDGAGGDDKVRWRERASARRGDAGAVEAQEGHRRQGGGLVSGGGEGEGEGEGGEGSDDDEEGSYSRTVPSSRSGGLSEGAGSGAGAWVEEAEAAERQASSAGEGPSSSSSVASSSASAPASRSPAYALPSSSRLRLLTRRPGALPPAPPPPPPSARASSAGPPPEGGGRSSPLSRAASPSPSAFPLPLPMLPPAVEAAASELAAAALTRNARGARAFPPRPATCALAAEVEREVARAERRLEESAQAVHDAVQRYEDSLGRLPSEDREDEDEDDGEDEDDVERFARGGARSESQDGSRLGENGSFRSRSPASSASSSPSRAVFQAQRALEDAEDAEDAARAGAARALAWRGRARVLATFLAETAERERGEDEEGDGPPTAALTAGWGGPRLAGRGGLSRGAWSGPGLAAKTPPSRSPTPVSIADAGIPTDANHDDGERKGPRLRATGSRPLSPTPGGAEALPSSTSSASLSSRPGAPAMTMGSSPASAGLSLDVAPLRGSLPPPLPAWNPAALQVWLLASCQLDDGLGGMRDKPGKSPDYYHTCYGLSGLALAQGYGTIVGGNRSALAETDVLLNVTTSAVDAARNALWNLDAQSARPWDGEEALLWLHPKEL